MKRITGSSKNVKNVGEKEGCLEVVDVELRLRWRWRERFGVACLS